MDWAFALLTIINPWHFPQAILRQAILLEPAPARMEDRLVAVDIEAPPGLVPRLVEVDPVSGRIQAEPPFEIVKGKLRFVAQGPIRRERLFLLYWAPRKAGWKPKLPDFSKAKTGDYATDLYGDPWDFDEGDQEGISQWGDKPSEYGKVRVEGGCLVIPVKGKDPYFIWGVMWGDPKSI